MHRRSRGPYYHAGTPGRPRRKARSPLPWRWRHSAAPNPPASAQVGRRFPRTGRLRDDTFPERATARARRHKARQGKERR